MKHDRQTNCPLVGCDKCDAWAFANMMPENVPCHVQGMCQPRTNTLVAQHLVNWQNNHKTPNASVHALIPMKEIQKSMEEQFGKKKTAA